MDNETVVFGRVVQGFRVFRLIEKADTVNEYPTPPVQIEESGAFTIEGVKMSPKK